MSTHQTTRISQYSMMLFHAILLNRNSDPLPLVLCCFAVAQASLLSSGSVAAATSLAQALAGR